MIPGLNERPPHAEILTRAFDMQLPVIDVVDAVVDDRAGSDDDDDGDGAAAMPDSDEFSREKMLALEHENATLKAELASLASVRLTVQHRFESICSIAPLLQPDGGAALAAVSEGGSRASGGSGGGGSSASVASPQVRAAVVAATQQLSRMASTVVAGASSRSSDSSPVDAAAGVDADDAVRSTCAAVTVCVCSLLPERV